MLWSSRSPPGGIDGRHPAAARLRREGGRLQALSTKPRSVGSAAWPGSVAGSALTVAYACASSPVSADARSPRRDMSEGACRWKPDRAGVCSRAGRARRPDRAARCRARSSPTCLIGAASHSLDAGSGAHLALWHGLTAALVLSAVALAAGAMLFLGRRRLMVARGRCSRRHPLGHGRLPRRPVRHSTRVSHPHHGCRAERIASDLRGVSSSPPRSCRSGAVAADHVAGMAGPY